MKIWVTKYALTEGIREEVAHECDGSDGMVMLTDPKYSWAPYLLVNDYRFTREAAVKRAEAMRLKSIASFKRRLAKLEAMRFE